MYSVEGKAMAIPGHAEQEGNSPEAVIPIE